MKNEISITDITAVRNRTHTNSVANVVTGDIIEAEAKVEISEEKPSEETKAK